MDNRGLLFIPDISGFTKFVNETEIGHSRLIIQELLEVLINNNSIGLEISEIEGDAILFYKFGPPPGLDALFNQVETMFCAFHRNLIAYESRRYCQCKACMSASGLTLKIITHFGEFTGYNVKQFSKLIGKDIIVVHQLLKNDIEQHEYWLVTNDLVNAELPADLVQSMNWNSSAKKTESGEIGFHYTLLNSLKEKIPPDPLPDPALGKKLKVFSVSREFETDIITLFHATGDFNFRGQWLDGVKSVEEVNHFLPRVGMRIKCIFENGQTMTYAASYSYSDDRIEFSEVEEGKGNVTYYTLEKLGAQKSKLTIDYFIEKNPLRLIEFNLLKRKKLERMYERSIQNIEPLVKQIQLPVES